MERLGFQNEKVNVGVPGTEWSYADNLAGREIFYLTGNLTKEKGKFDDKRTPLAVRAIRADDFHELNKLREKRKEILKNGQNITQNDLNLLEYVKHRKKEISEKNKDLLRVCDQFLNNRKIAEVDMEELGTQKAQYVELVPNGVKKDTPPIVLILGISNDLEGCGVFPMELAIETKRKVVVFSYPESRRGSVTKEYCEAVKRSDNFEPYVDFFEKAINQAVGEEKIIDFCGFSTGSLISALLISNKGFGRRVDQINLIVPPGIVTTTPLNTPVRLIFEGVGLIKQLKNFPKISSNTSETIQKTREEIRVRQETYKNLYNKLAKEYPWWKGNLECISGKKIKVVICDNDGITWGRIGKEKLEENNKNIEVEIIRGGWPHMTPATDPKRIIKELDGYQKVTEKVEEK
jgi:hypothetical protein